MLRHGPCLSPTGVPYTTSTPSFSALSRRGISSGGCWRSSSSVTTTCPREARMPARSALCCPKLRRRFMARTREHPPGNFSIKSQGVAKQDVGELTRRELGRRISDQSAGPDPSTEPRERPEKPEQREHLVDH